MNRIVKSPSLLRVARVSAGMAQWELARLIGRSCSFVSRLENGEPVPLTRELAAKIGNLLSLPGAMVLIAAHQAKPSGRLGKTPLHTAIRAAGITQRSVARKVGIEQWVMSEIVVGRAAPTPELAAEIAEAIGTPVEKLFPDLGKGTA
jgi:DNA-binding XRE family transcriptional regulator